MDAQISGTGHVDLKNLESTNIDLSVSGTGQVLVNATDVLSVEASGMAKVKVYGEPKDFDSHTSGLAKIEKISGNKYKP